MRWFIFVAALLVTPAAALAQAPNRAVFGFVYDPFRLLVVAAAETDDGPNGTIRNISPGEDWTAVIECLEFVDDPQSSARRVYIRANSEELGHTLRIGITDWGITEHGDAFGVYPPDAEEDLVHPCGAPTVEGVSLNHQFVVLP